MATLTYEPFTNDVNEEFLEINTDAEDEEALDNYFQEKAKEYINIWIK